jgi:hypothetical protein
MATLETKPTAAPAAAPSAKVAVAAPAKTPFYTVAFDWFVKKQSFSNWLVVVIGVAAFVGGRLV